MYMGMGKGVYDLWLLACLPEPKMHHKLKLCGAQRQRMHPVNVFIALRARDFESQASAGFHRRRHGSARIAPSWPLPATRKRRRANAALTERVRSAYVGARRRCKPL